MFEIFLIKNNPEIAILQIIFLVFGLILKEKNSNKPKTSKELLKELWKKNNEFLLKPKSKIDIIQDLAYIISKTLIEKKWSVDRFASEIGINFDLAKNCLLGTYSFLEKELDIIEKKLEIDLSSYKKIYK